MQSKTIVNVEINQNEQIKGEDDEGNGQATERAKTKA